MGPAPVTSTRWPSPTSARCTAHTATASGSIIEPTTVSMESGSGCAARSGTTRYSLMVPCVGGEPRQVPFGQTLYAPCRHVAQRPHPSAGSTATRVPTATRAPGPAATTTPEAS